MKFFGKDNKVMSEPEIKKICKDCKLIMRKDADRTKSYDPKNPDGPDIDYKPFLQRIMYDKAGKVIGITTEWLPA